MKQSNDSLPTGTEAPLCASLLTDSEQPDVTTSDVLLNSRVRALVLRAYNSLPAHGKPGQQEGTVVAAVVLSDGAKALSLVSLATGTKCLNYNTSADGRLAHDLHAEVLARRAACLWLYRQFHHCLQCSSCKTSVQPPIVAEAVQVLFLCVLTS